MPFSKLKLLYPEQMEALHEAFRRVCDILKIDCSGDEKLTELVVLKIVELAKTGERNPEVLCIDTIAAFEASSDDGAQRPASRQRQVCGADRFAVGRAWPDTGDRPRHTGAMGVGTRGLDI
jgi:hypothetical protein